MQSSRISDLRTDPLPTRIPNDQTYDREESLSLLIGPHTSTDEGSWDYLLEKWDNDAVPVLSAEEDSVDQDSTDISEDTDEGNSMDGMNVEDQEPVHSEKGRGRLAPNQIETIINEFISQYTEKWTPGKHADSVVDQAFDAHELWNELRSQSLEERQRVISDTRKGIEWYEYKLDKLCETIFLDQWTSEKAVKQQCASLESTIDLLEQEKWELYVYQLQSPPPKMFEDEPRDLPVEPNSEHPRTESHSQLDHNDEYTIYTDEIIDLGSGSESEDAGDNCQTLSEEISGTSYTYFGDTSSRALGMERGSQVSDDMIIDTVEFTDSIKDLPKLRQYPLMPMTPPLPQPSIRAQDPPEDASYTTVSKWEWDELRSKRDRKRIVMKVLQQMPSPDLEAIRTNIQTTRKQDLVPQVSLCVNTFLRNENNIPSAIPQNMPKIAKFTKLFLCWWLADDCFNDTAKAIEDWRVQELADCLREEDRDVGIFVDWTKYVLKNTFSAEALADLWAPSQAEVIVISDDEGPILR